MHGLKVFAMENHLKSTDTPYTMRSRCEEVTEFDELLDAVFEGKNAASRPEIQAALLNVFTKIGERLAMGHQVKLPIGTLYMCAHGKVKDKSQAFSPFEGDDGHGLTAHFRSNKEWEDKVARETKWERVELFDKTSPLIEKVTIAGKEDHAANQGDTIIVQGSRLKFDAKDPSCGISLESGDEHITCTVYPKILPSEIIATIPKDMPNGVYTLVVYTKPNDKDIKACTHKATITIESEKK